ncbi:MAG: Ribosomal L25p family [Pseudomonadota bacterium]|jgi:ribosomal protein L25 (general stress protein Ctc)
MSNKKEVSIEATLRTGLGKSYTRKLRRNGKVPAILNSKGQSTMLELDPKLLSKAWRDCDKQFDLLVDGKSQRVRITELQIDPVKRLALHVDLAPLG